MDFNKFRTFLIAIFVFFSWINLSFAFFSKEEEMSLGLEAELLSIEPDFTETNDNELKPPSEYIEEKIAEPIAASSNKVIGVPIADLVPNAPQTYTVKKGDTLWRISGIFLKKPHRWPELWGMNKEQIKNPHLIYPKQVLRINIVNGYATLGADGISSYDDGIVRLTPTIRTTPLDEYQAIDTLPLKQLNSFFNNPIILNIDTVKNAPRIVAMVDERVLFTNNAIVYARSTQGKQLTRELGENKIFRIFRNTTPLRDPKSGRLLGYEARYLGRAILQSSEIFADSKINAKYSPAKIKIVDMVEEIQAGDRLVVEPEILNNNYVLHSPEHQVKALVSGLYSQTANQLAGGQQVISINMGSADGLEPGHILNLTKKGRRFNDKTAGFSRITLPTENNGLAVVYRTFTKVSYALIMESFKEVEVGDELVNPE